MEQVVVCPIWKDIHVGIEEAVHVLSLPLLCRSGQVGVNRLYLTAKNYLLLYIYEFRIETLTLFSVGKYTVNRWQLFVK